MASSRSTIRDAIDPPEWPANLDAMIAAPEHHVLLLENDAVRVFDTSILPGHTVPLHTHCWPQTLYLISWSECIRRDAQGAVGSAFWSPALPAHTLENIGDSILRLISVELKTA